MADKNTSDTEDKQVSVTDDEDDEPGNVAEDEDMEKKDETNNKAGDEEADKEDETGSKADGGDAGKEDETGSGADVKDEAGDGDAGFQVADTLIDIPDTCEGEEEIDLTEIEDTPMESEPLQLSAFQCDAALDFADYYGGSEGAESEIGNENDDDIVDDETIAKDIQEKEIQNAITIDEQVKQDEKIARDLAKRKGAAATALQAGISYAGCVAGSSSDVVSSVATAGCNAAREQNIKFLQDKLAMLQAKLLGKSIA